MRIRSERKRNAIANVGLTMNSNYNKHVCLENVTNNLNQSNDNSHKSDSIGDSSLSSVLRTNLIFQSFRLHTRKRTKERFTDRFILIQLFKSLLPLLLHMIKPSFLGVKLGRIQHIGNANGDQGLLVNLQADFIHHVLLAVGENNLTGNLQVVSNFHNACL